MRPARPDLSACRHCGEPISFDGTGWDSNRRQTRYLGADGHRHEPLTMTCGELIAALSQFDPAKPVTIDIQDCDGPNNSWLNIGGAFLPNAGAGDEGPSVLLIARDDFDTRQW